MSVVIKDMEMPKSCRDCPFNNENAWCLAPGEWRDRYHIPQSGRSKACPLVPYSDNGRDWKELQKSSLFSTLEPKVIDVAKALFNQNWSWKQIRSLYEFMVDEAIYKAEIELADTIDFKEDDVK